MYAIIKTGGKQYRVEKDGFIDVELLNIESGSPVEFNEVLFFSDGSKSHVGSPHIADFVVKGEVLECVPGPKVESMKYKQRKSQYRRFGHRQHYSRVQINFIGKRDEEHHAKHPKKKKKEEQES